VGCAPEVDVTLTLKVTAVPDLNDDPLAGAVILKVGVGNTPAPPRVTLSAPFTVLSSSVSVADRAPVPEGVKMTPILQVWPAYIDAPGVSTQVVVVLSTLKSAAFAPVKTTFVSVMSELPVLVTVTSWATPATPLVWFPKAN
jgi:hypothetical protein